MNIVCSIVGIGNTLQECFDHIKEISDEVDCEDKNVQLDALDRAMETVKKAKEYGIFFDVGGESDKELDEPEESKTGRKKPYKSRLYYQDDLTDRIMAWQQSDQDSVGPADEEE